MDQQFNDIQNLPENEIFRVVFYPDRIYHAQYLNATRSPRYRYYVHEVRNKLDIMVLKGIVFMDSDRICNFLRIEYRASRLTEQTREKERFLQESILAYIKLDPVGGAPVDATVRMHYCPWIDAFQVELWETLDPAPTKRHDLKVSHMMGAQGQITCVSNFNPVLANMDSLKQVELAFRESDLDAPFGFRINNPQWDNDYFRSYQTPRTQAPSADQNTIRVNNYLVDFQRGWYFDNVADMLPVRYKNAMMEPSSPDFKPGPDQNIIEMRWVVQRELGSSIVYFHEVTIPPGCVEGTHRHIGSEELYYIFEGEGIAYMGDGDDPALSDPAKHPQLDVEIYGIGTRTIREVKVKPRSVIFTKSGGIHGIRNPGDTPLRFVAFGYHSA